MIRMRKAFLLAGTKLKTRRIRLVMLLVAMSAMFAGLVFIATISTGVTRSLQKFGASGYGGRFLVQAIPITYQSYNDTPLTDQLKPQQEALVTQKTALAKKLGVSYDAASDSSLYYTNQRTGGGADDIQRVLTGSPLAVTALEAQNRAIPGIGFDDFGKLAKAAGATQLYQSSAAVGGSNQAAGSTGGMLRVLTAGKEDYSDLSGTGGQQHYYPTGVQSIQTLGWSQTSDKLLQPFLLAGQTTKVGADGSIPVVAPYSAVEQILNLPVLSATATADQKLHRLEQVRAKIAGKTAQLCYRNAASETLLQKAVEQQAYIANNKGKTGYVAPHLLYALPTDSCGAVTVQTDKRSAEEKKADANQQTFDDTFNPAPDATQGIITLRLVGIAPDVDTGGSSLSVAAGLTSILSSTLGYGWFSPANGFTTGSIATQAQGGMVADQPVMQQRYYAEFPTLQAATAFIKHANCTVNNLSANGQYDPNASVTACGAARHPFTLEPYGNNAGAIASFQHTAWKFMKYVVLVIVVIAAIIMVSTFGKVIADSRRETAVFRSLGASRLDISQIYLTYTLLVSLLVVLAAICIGVLGAAIVNGRVSPGLSINAVLVYNASDLHAKFSLIGFSLPYLLGIMGLIVLVGFLSALIPLFTNMRRNPIRDMRDE